MNEKREAIVVTASDVETKRVEWLWPNRIPLGKFTLLCGNPDVGKSLLTAEMAAIITGAAERTWPDGGNRPYGHVFVLTDEDELDDTAVPRLIAAGADLKRVHFMKGVKVTKGKNETTEEHVDISGHIGDVLGAVSKFPDCKLIVLDPITAYTGKIDQNDNKAVRDALDPLTILAAERGIAVVGLMHLNKKSTEGTALYRAAGSMAWVARARAAWLLSRDKDNPERRLLTKLKGNIAPDVGGLAFGIVVGVYSDQPSIAWEDDAISITADEALQSDAPRKRGRPPAKSGEVKEWLRNALKDGPRPSKEILDEAADLDYSSSTVTRVRCELKIKAVTIDGVRHMKLPEPADSQNSVAA